MRNRFICSFFDHARARYFTFALVSLLLVACSGPVYKARYKPAYQPNSSYPVKASKRSVLVKAKSLLGKPYRYGGNHPATGFDCSGFVQYTHAVAGIDLPRTTYQQLRATHPISRQQLRPGDLIFFRINRKRFVSHVGIYLGNGEFIHSPSSGKHVTIAKLDNPYWRKVYSSAGRVF
jgi:cell wall-associated NlpC family hydrolase